MKTQNEIQTPSGLRKAACSAPRHHKVSVTANHRAMGIQNCWNFCPYCGVKIYPITTSRALENISSRLTPNTRIETDAVAPAWPTPHGRAADCWVIEDRGENVLIGYGHDDRALVPRSSIYLPNAKHIHPDSTPNDHE